MSSVNRGFFLLRDLLPPEISAENQLCVTETILFLAKEALSAFSQRQLAKFDPAVGDELCEIRAIQAVLLSRMDLTDEMEAAECAFNNALIQLGVKKTALQKAKERLNEDLASKKALQEPFILEKAGLAKKRVAEPIPTGTQAEIKACKQAIKTKYEEKFRELNEKLEPIENDIQNIRQDYLNQCHLIVSNSPIDISVSEKINSIILAYFLTVVKSEVVEKNTFGYFVVGKQPSVAKLNGPAAIYDRAVPLLKKAVIQQSTAFVQGAGLMTRTRMVPGKNFEALPFYYVLKTVYAKAVEEKIPILFKVRDQQKYPDFTLQAFFKVEGGKYVPSTPEKNTAALVVEAFSSQMRDNLITEVMEETGGLLNYLVEIDGAQHTQYPDQTMFEAIPDLPAAEKERLEESAKFAREKGVYPQPKNQVLRRARLCRLPKWRQLICKTGNNSRSFKWGALYASLSYWWGKRLAKRMASTRLFW